ncbi:fatty acid hydroxylase [Polymorphobacter glacialis]|uniref:Fatty acid hydroxylase n=1 Tax=Sandarakinorhabdus glacialis TaxID=1614636 RepID=A0A916ZIZ9_9SPHN|nr:sterol desaturase family protein [Polymorphobacter glacialis]GGD99957.1 fatty acid hydroxylase [Polymorphobacter glacialis]
MVAAFIVDVLRLCGWLAFLTAVFVPIERLFARSPSTLFRRETANDLGYYFLNSLVPAALMAAPLALVAATVQQVVPSGFHVFMRGLPLWASIPIGLVVADIGSYWGHRISHASPTLWRFHAVHHSAEHMDFLVNTRAHPVDMVVTRMFGLVPLYILGLGTAGAAGSLLPVVITLIGTFAGFFIHANVRWRMGPVEWLVATPAFHHWHHSRNDHINRNFAATFPVIDRIFGTHYLPAHFPAEYGLEERLPETMTGQLIGPIVGGRRVAPSR